MALIVFGKNLKIISNTIQVTKTHHKLSAYHDSLWRKPADVVAQWENDNQKDKNIFAYKIIGKWWDILGRSGMSLFVSREYEHVLMELSYDEAPRISYIKIPHPSGLAFDPKKKSLFVALTRNPNQIMQLSPIQSFNQRTDLHLQQSTVKQYTDTFVPIKSFYYPGCFYIHDLALINYELYANSVGQNAVIKINDDGSYSYAWWPKCIVKNKRPQFDKNYIQLNSIAAGRNISTSFFSASTDSISNRRPGHQNFIVDKKGVVFSGLTRNPIAYGLTRPHSARFHHKKIWVDNSGYGEIGYIENKKFFSIKKLPGWTRGLAFKKNIAFVGTSRILPLFKQYAPGLDIKGSICGVHAVNCNNGEVLGSILWPYGNQIFSLELVPNSISKGLPYHINRFNQQNIERKIFYSFKIN